MSPFFKASESRSVTFAHMNDKAVDSAGQLDSTGQQAGQDAAAPDAVAALRDAGGTGAAQQPMGELLRLAADEALPVVRAIRDDQLAAPTPCAEYDVRTLVNHLFHVLVQFRKLAARQNDQFGTPPDYVGQGDDWRERFAKAADDLVAAWSEPGVEEGTTGSMNLPARVVASMALTDVTVHAWDLARATGQGYQPAGRAVDVLRYLQELFVDMVPTGRKMGAFGEPFPLPEGAAAAGLTEFDRLLAEIGRNPDWTPPGA